MALRTECGSCREAARVMRSARGFKEAFEEMASVNLFSSSLICEPSSSCSFILFLDLESDDGGAIEKMWTGDSGRHRMEVYYVINRTNKRKLKETNSNQEMEMESQSHVLYYPVEQQMSRNSGLGMATTFVVNITNIQVINETLSSLLFVVNSTSLSVHIKQVIVIPSDDRSTERA
jgi:hypothetical protein